MHVPLQVKIQNVAPRDRFHSLRDFISTDQKLQSMEAISYAGAREIKLPLL
jgi:hypothetical protein